MARIRRADVEEEPDVILPAHCLIGRSSSCALRLTSGAASREHARLSFTGGAWSLRDLGATNGTFVNGARLAAGGVRELAAGDRLGFGEPACGWLLVDAAPPVAVARRLESPEQVQAEDGVLALPSAEAPLACVLEREGAWLLELAGTARRVRDGELIEVAGRWYALCLPQPQAITAPVDAQWRISDVELRFRVSRDEERVEVEVVAPGAVRVLPPRAHHYTWLTLARARLRDRGGRGLSEPQQGWLDVDELCASLRVDEMHLNVEIHRIRKDLAALEVQGSAAVIERRRGVRQLRLGTARVQVATME
jgi:hypothetical protein